MRRMVRADRICRHPGATQLLSRSALDRRAACNGLMFAQSANNSTAALKKFVDLQRARSLRRKTISGPNAFLPGTRFRQNVAR